jgi:hypothetical protein
MRKDKTTRELLEELHYWQMRVRMDIKSLRRTTTKCREIAAALRERQSCVKAQATSKTRKETHAP